MPIPLKGDRGVFNVADYAPLHASDLEAAAPTVHSPLPTVINTVPVSDGSKWVASTLGAENLDIIAGGANFFQNSTFQIYTTNNDTPDGWVQWCAEGGVTYSVETSGGVDNRNYWHFEWDETIGDKLYVYSAYSFVFLPNETYVISFWAKGTLADQPFVYSDPAAATEVWLERPNITTAWQRYAVRITWGATVPTVVMVGCNAPASGEVDFDHFQLQHSDILAGWQPYPSELESGSVLTDKIGDAQVTADKLSITTGGANLLLNSTFQMDSNADGSADTWDIDVADATTQTNSIQATGGVDNRAFQRVAWTGTPSAVNVMSSDALGGGVRGGCLGSTTYVVSFWVKGTAFGVPELGWNGTAPESVTYISQTLLGTDWFRYVASVRFASPEAVVEPIIVCETTTADAYFDVDHVQVEQADVPSSWKPYPSELEPGSVTANLFSAQAANIVLAGPASGAATVPTFRQLVSGDIPDLSSAYLTPSGHTAIGNGSPHHTPVSLDANADTLLSLSTQTLGLDTQAANKILSGPTTGANAVPTFRALVAADIPGRVDSNDPTGFVSRSTSTLTFTDGTLTLSIAPVSSSFVFYSAGTLFTKTTAQTKVIANTVGLHYIYFDTAGVLSESVTPWDIASANVPVACVYWDGYAGILMDERHGIQMDGRTHEYLHETRGPAFASGLAGTFAADGSTITIGSGEWYDDDLEYLPAQQTTCRMFWLIETTWQWSAPQAAYFYVDAFPQYNLGGQLANVSVNRYSISWVFHTNHTTTPIAVIMHTAQYTTQALAEAASFPTLADLPASEMLLLYKVVWQRNGSVIAWKSTTDYRRVSGGAILNYVATDHGALAGLSDDDHPQYLLATGTRTGASSQAQTFTNGIIGPTWKPAADSTTALQIQKAAGSPIVTLDTTNSKISIAATSVGLYAATPVEQATTAGAAATFSQLSGNTVNDASTFDGYTLAQVVKALRNIGVLA